MSAEPSQVEEQFSSPNSVSQEKAEVIKPLPDKKEDINTQDKDGWTRLHYAILNEDFELIKLLINHQPADLHAYDKEGNTPLHRAVLQQKIGVIFYLLELGAKIDARNPSGYTPLHWAADLGLTEIAAFLLARGADPRIKGGENKDQTPLMWAKAKNHGETVKLLSDLLAIANCAARNGNLPLLQELMSERKNLVNTLYAQNRQTLLHLAAFNGHVAVVSYLLEQGAYINAKDTNDRTSLHLAASNGHVAVVSCLLKQGAQINAKDTNDRTPLHLAASNGHVAVVRYLLEQGAHINAKDTKDLTSLHLAASNGHVEAVTYLLEQGANIKAKDIKENTPLHLASGHGHATVVEFLLEKSAKIIMNEENEKRETPLHEAVLGGHIEAVKLLLRYGAHADPRDRDGLKPIHFAKGERSKFLKQIEEVKEQQASPIMIMPVLGQQAQQLQQAQQSQQEQLSQMQRAYSNYTEIVKCIEEAPRKAAEKESMPSASLSGNSMRYFVRLKEEESPTTFDPATMRMLALLQAAALFGIAAMVVILAIWLAQPDQVENNNEWKRPSFQK